MRCTGSCPGHGNPLPRQGTVLREAVFWRCLFVSCKDTLQRPLNLGFGSILGSFWMLLGPPNEGLVCNVQRYASGVLFHCLLFENLIFFLAGNALLLFNLPCPSSSRLAQTIDFLHVFLSCCFSLLLPLATRRLPELSLKMPWFVICFVPLQSPIKSFFGAFFSSGRCPKLTESCPGVLASPTAAKLTSRAGSVASLGGSNPAAHGGAGSKNWVSVGLAVFFAPRLRSAVPWTPF